MQWKADLENLFAQTKAMIRSANPNSIRTAPPAEATPSGVLPPGGPTATNSPPSAVSSPGKPSESEMPWRSPVREEITQRVAGFKAHQEKMRREREDYYQETIARTRALLQDDGKTDPKVP